MASMSTTVTSSPQPVVNNYTVTYNLTTSTKFNPSMAIIIVVLMSALFFLGFFSIYVRNCTMADGEEASSGGHNPRPTAQTSSSSRPKGLDKSVVEALPVVHFKDLNLEMQDGNAGLDDGKPPEECRQDVHRECAVCLSEFESEDSLRLLPKCKHVFHLECIDVWFQSHSTCPLCRASLVPKETQHGHDAREGEDQAESVVIVGEQGRAGDGAAFEEAPLEVVLTIDPDDSGEGARESQEDTQSAELQVDSTRSGTTTEGTSSSVESSISRDDQRDTARLALFRNSQSFKKAARGVVAHERAGTSTVSDLETWTSLKSWKAPTPGNEPMHRSTSLDIDGKSMKDVFSSSQAPKLVSQHSVPAAMNLATINLPMESKLGIQRTGSYSGLVLLRTDSMNSMEKAPFTGSKPIRSNSEHWVRIELDSAPESLGVGPSKTKPVLQLGLDESPIINRGIKTGNFERWRFLNLQTHNLCKASFELAPAP